MSGSFKAWARDLKDYARMADPATLNLLRLGETNIEENISLDQVEGVEGATPEMDQDLHYFMCRFLDGEAKMLSLNAEIGSFSGEHKSGAELWRLLMFNYEKKSAYSIVNIMGMIRNVEKAKSMADIQPKIATLQRLYIEFAKGFLESTDKDIIDHKDKLATMSTVGYFEVFKKADLLKYCQKQC